MVPTVFIHTLGCRTNIADSSLLGRRLTAGGFALVTEAATADIVLVNSCTVTNGADRDVGKALRRLRRDNPSQLLVVTGCLPAAQRRHPALDGADLALPGNEPEAVVDAISAAIARAGWSAPAGPGPAALRAYEDASGLTRATIKIHEGCDCHCAYCIVPTARGAPVSRPVDDVMADVEGALSAGFQELVIAGTHLARYGLERGEEDGLVELMKRLEAYSGSCRFRLSSLEPDSRLEGIIEQLAGNSCWCPHLHLALQHGSDRILADMRRPYLVAEIGRTLEQVARQLPEANVGADFIVGYPTEDDARFEEGFARVKELPLHYLHVFAYSPRPGTRAAQLPRSSTSAEVKARSAALRKWADGQQESFRQSMVGTVREILVEKRRQKSGNQLMALTDNYLLLVVDGPDHWTGSRKMVQVELSTEGSLAGRSIDVVE